MPTERVQYLVKRFLEDGCTQQELEELAHWVDASADDAQLNALLETAWKSHTPSTEMPEQMSQRLLAAMFKEEPAPRVHFMKRYGWWAAAAVLLLAVISYPLFIKRDTSTLAQTIQTQTITAG